MMKDNFFGRTANLETLRKRIGDLKEGYRQNLAIIGDELVGKSSIIFKFLDSFYDPYIIPVYLEMRPETLLSFSRRFIGVLLYNFLSGSGIPLKEDLDFLVSRSSRYIPRTVEKIRLLLASLEKKRKGGSFSELLALSDLIHQETGKFCVIVFDEFDILESLGIKNIYGEWSKQIITQKSTMYIIVSSAKFKAKAVLAKNLSLLFGNFEIITVEPFDIITSEAYLEKKVGRTGLSTGLRNFLIHFTGGYPFYLDVITDALLSREVTEETLADTIENLLCEPSGILNQRFSNYLKRFLGCAHSKDYVSFLYQVACGHNRLKDVAHILRKPKQELIGQVAYLLENDVITRNGEFFRITDRVFGFWLKFVYQEKMRSLTFDSRSQKALFRESVESMIREFLESGKRTISERMAELLHLFDDDTIQVEEKKKMRLLHFREIKPLEFKNKGLREGLLGRSSEGTWVMAFKYDSLMEDDIVDFVRECKKYGRHKLQKKIIVAFQDVDANARLKAMDEKILTWDLNNLNQILDLFSRPRIII